MRKIMYAILIAALLIAGCSDNGGTKMDEKTAVFETNKGTFEIELFTEKAPITTQNFIDLTNKGFYDGLIFHRIIAEFMIQGGDPEGRGSGGPGYTIKDEFHPDLKHDSVGVLSMANSGPNTGGSQFFITLAPTPWLDGKHTVFGAVEGAEDQSVVNSIAMGDKIESVTIVGDTTALFEQVTDLLENWNAVLDEG